MEKSENLKMSKNFRPFSPSFPKHVSHPFPHCICLTSESLSALFVQVGESLPFLGVVNTALDMFALGWEMHLEMEFSTAQKQLWDGWRSERNQFIVFLLESRFLGICQTSRSCEWQCLAQLPNLFYLLPRASLTNAAFCSTAQAPLVGFVGGALVWFRFVFL